jgi:hypothetical protein
MAWRIPVHHGFVRGLLLPLWTELGRFLRGHGKRIVRSRRAPASLKYPDDAEHGSGKMQVSLYPQGMAGDQWLPWNSRAACLIYAGTHCIASDLWSRHYIKTTSLRRAGGSVGRPPRSYFTDEY